jgi:membrane protein DedA with SNARE-associated domain
MIFANNWRVAAEYLALYSKVVSVIVVAALVIFLWWFFRKRRNANAAAINGGLKIED